MTPHPTLGSISPQQFMRAHWQKKPRWITDAQLGDDHVLSREAIQALAQREDVESRLIQKVGKAWQLSHGPFTANTFQSLPDSNWTLLVQGVNRHVPAVQALLEKFNFLPYARLDDVMLSLAAPGGGVGPHLDSYDVFLLQGFGNRRWGINEAPDQALDSKQPLKILKSFKAEDKRDLAPGQLLYLPPQVAHDGVALDWCTTYSIGFRAPTQKEIVSSFLDYVQEHVIAPDRFADPDLKATDTPAALSTQYVKEIQRQLTALTWTKSDIAQFAGCFASELKQDVVFTPPSPALGFRAFNQRFAKQSLRLSASAILLYDDNLFYLNGEVLDIDPDAEEFDAWAAFADTRATGDHARFGEDSKSQLHELYAEGIVYWA
jgi:50S ribosomal protein L16 3-hydroxylase